MAGLYQEARAVDRSLLTRLSQYKHPQSCVSRQPACSYAYAPRVCYPQTAFNRVKSVYWPSRSNVKHERGKDKVFQHAALSLLI